MRTEHARGIRLDEGIERGRALSLSVDGRVVEAFEGESVAAALFAMGLRALRTTALREEPRGVFCGIGLCFDCVMTIDGRPNVRACRTPVREGMRVETQQGDGAWTNEGLPTRRE